MNWIGEWMAEAERNQGSGGDPLEPPRLCSSAHIASSACLHSISVRRIIRQPGVDASPRLLNAPLHDGNTAQQLIAPTEFTTR